MDSLWLLKEFCWPNIIRLSQSMVLLPKRIARNFVNGVRYAMDDTRDARIDAKYTMNDVRDAVDDVKYVLDDAQYALDDARDDLVDTKYDLNHARIALNDAI